jgi:hypothetical protein
VAMASFQAARRTQSAYPRFLASTNPSDLDVSVYTAVGGTAVRNLTAAFGHLRYVRDVTTAYVPHIVPLSAHGAARVALLANVSFVASADGQFNQVDRLAVTKGRLANLNRIDEMVLDANAARLLGAHVGSVISMGVFTEVQGNSAGFGTPKVQPIERIAMHVTGIVTENTSVVEDDVDRSYGFGFLTPALLRYVLSVAPAGDDTPYYYALQLTGGARDVPAVEAEVRPILPPGAVSEFHVTSRAVTTVELAVRPMSIALAGFGVIAALACLVLGMQAISRLLRDGDEDRRVLRFLGASPLATVADALFGVGVAIIAGVVVAVGVAILLSPISPIGPVRPVYPDRGVALDWEVYLFGTVAVVSVLASFSSFQAWRSTVRRRSSRVRTPSRAVKGAEAAGMPVTAVIGVQFALDPGADNTSVPLRSVLLGTIVAVALVVATLTFSSSFKTLVSDPPLYGWNWSYALLPTNNVPLSSSTLLDQDHLIAAWTGMDYNIVTIDGLAVPVLMERGTRNAVTPPVLSGHVVEASDQIVIGASTLAELHRRVGQSVEVSYGSPGSGPLYVAPIRLRIVGTATFPAIGYASQVADHTSMGTGALFSEKILPRVFDRAVTNPDPNLQGPDLVFVRLRHGVSAAAGRANLDRVAAAIDRIYAADPHASNNDVVVLGVQRPAQIVNYQSVGSTPVVLAVGLAAGALAALALTLIASVRRRRRDLALMKALGLTARQLAAAVAWQSTVAAVTGVLIGIPLGIVLGRQLWILFARELNAVPAPTVPALELVLVAIGTLVFANVVALFPGRSAARTPSALILRVE